MYRAKIIDLFENYRVIDTGIDIKPDFDFIDRPYVSWSGRGEHLIVSTSDLIKVYGMDANNSVDLFIHNGKYNRIPSSVSLSPMGTRLAFGVYDRNSEKVDLLDKRVLYVYDFINGELIRLGGLAYKSDDGMYSTAPPVWVDDDNLYDYSTTTSKYLFNVISREFTMQ